jgi:O-antigen/teichoic acid export membrane protein
LILTIGEIVNVLTGPVGSLLQMSKHEREYANCTFLGGLTQLVLCVILIPRFGATGAAIATAIALSLTNLSALAYTYNRLGIIPIPILGARLAVNKIDGSRPDD